MSKKPTSDSEDPTPGDRRGLIYISIGFGLFSGRAMLLDGSAFFPRSAALGYIAIVALSEFCSKAQPAI